MLTAVALDTPRPIAERNPNISDGFRKLCMKLLEKEPDQRPRSAVEVIRWIDALERSPDQRTTSVEVTPVIVTTPRPASTAIEAGLVFRLRRRRLWPAVAVLALFLVTAIGAYFGFVANNGGEARAHKPDESDPKNRESTTPACLGVIVLENDDSPGAGDCLTFIDATGEVRFRLKGFDACDTIATAHTIAVDRHHERVWVLENNRARIRCFDFHGNQLRQIDQVDATAIAVDPATGHVWAVVGRKTGENYAVAVYDNEGQVVARYSAGGFDIVFNPVDKSFWVAGSRVTKLRASDGEVVFSERVSTWWGAALAVDSRDGSVWVVSRDLRPDDKEIDQLLKFSITGEKLATVDLGSKIPSHLTVDPREGEVCVSFRREPIERFDQNGKLIATLSRSGLAAQADLNHPGLWVATANGIERLTADGTLSQRFPNTRRATSAWIAPVN
jgi:hypothetical protein